MDANQTSPSMKTSSFWDKDTIKYYHSLLSRKFCVPCVQVSCFHASSITGLPTINLMVIPLASAGTAPTSVFFIFRSETHRRHYHYPVRIYTSRLVPLHRWYTAHPPSRHGRKDLDHLAEKVTDSISFNICHCSSDNQILGLNQLNEFYKTFMIARIIFAIDFKSCRIKGIECIHSDASLKTCTCQLPEFSCILFWLTVLCTFCNVQKSINFPICKRGMGRFAISGSAACNIVGFSPPH